MQRQKEEAGGSPERGKQDQWTEKDVRRLHKEMDESGEPVATFARRQGFKAQRLTGG